MNPFNIRQPQDRRKVYNEYLAGLQMQIDNLAKTEAAVDALEKTGAPPVQPTDTRTLSEKLLDVDKQKKVLRQALLEITDGAEASKIMNTISDEDVVFLGVAFGDFSKMIKQKFSSGILAPLFNEVLQRYKRDYINSLSVQKGISTGHTTEELLLSIRELLRLTPTAAQLRDLRFAIENIPAGVVPERMRSAGLLAAADLSALIPSADMVQAIDRLNPIDRASAERALNDGLSSITSGAILQDLTGRLQQASPKQTPDILSTIIKDIILTREENNMVELYRLIRKSLGYSGEGMKMPKDKKGKRITFGCGLVRAIKPTMMVKPENIDALAGIKKEPSYIPIGKYVVNKHKLRDNMLLMRTVKGGQIAELPQMSISPKLGKMLNNIINGRGFPTHDELSSLEDSDKDIMYKVFKMSKAEGIDAIPRPNKTKDEAEFNRFSILKGQILAGNNSKELIKEFKSLLVKLIHNGKILRKEGHDILLDLAALGF